MCSRLSVCCEKKFAGGIEKEAEKIRVASSDETHWTTERASKLWLLPPPCRSRVLQWTVVPLVPVGTLNKWSTAAHSVDFIGDVLLWGDTSTSPYLQLTASSWTQNAVQRTISRVLGTEANTGGQSSLHRPKVLNSKMLWFGETVREQCPGDQDCWPRLRFHQR